MVKNNSKYLAEKLKIPENLVFTLETGKDLSLPKRVWKSLNDLKVDEFVVYENRVIALFFNFENKDAPKDLHTKIWNTNINPLAIFVNADIYNGFSFDSNQEKTSFEKFLDKHGEPIEPEKFSIWDYLLGDKLQEIKQKNTVDFELLENLKNTKLELEKECLNDELANNLLGRLLFVAFLYDRKLIFEKVGLKKFLDSKQGKRKNLCELIRDKEELYKFFEALKSELDGDLFPVKWEEDKIEIYEKDLVEDKHLEILSDLFAGGNSLFEMYDFSLIPVELISEIYEQLMGKRKQKEKSAYYTPSFLVDYIIAKTVQPHLKINKSCKVFDPSCGSGIFLVESLRQIIEANLVDKKIEHEKLKNLATENIFGVDLDETAINITIFSLYLVLLDYVDRDEISTFRFPNLKDTNIFKGDFFDEKNNTIIKNQELDFILGNPPWKRGQKGSHIEYAKNHKIPVSDKQIAQTFVARIKEFSENNQPECFLVLPSQSMFYGSNGEKFRQEFWLKNAKIKEVLELSSVRKKGYLFSKAQSPTSLIRFQYSNNENEIKNNIILHTSLKPNIFLKKLKLIVIEKNDEKRIKQKYFIENDWLWKTILYGNVLDYYFIKKIKEKFIKIQEIDNLVFGAGFITGENSESEENKNKRKYRSVLKNYSFIEKNDLKFIKENWFASKEIQEIAKNQKIITTYPSLKFKDAGVVNSYQSPHILLRRSLNKKPTFVFLYEELAFPNTIFGIHHKDTNLLYYLMAYLSSSLATYFLFNLSATWGVRQEEIYPEEYNKLPIILDKNNIEILANKFSKIIEIQNKSYDFNLDNEEEKQKQEVEKILKQIDNQLLEMFEISDFERKLINYTQEISIPLYFNEKKPIEELEFEDERLEQYAQIFYDFFSQRWNSDNTYFSVKIYWHKYVVAMSFEVSEKEPKEKIEFIEIKKDENKDIFEKIKEKIKLGEEQITKTFFKQRDVRGFNKNSFFVVKPNQYKNWHPAVAEADVREFVAEMQKAAKKSLNSKNTNL
jgi:N-6 DNA Methylase